VVIELVVSAGVPATVCPVVRRLLVHRGVVDRPNDRSSHVVPTPRDGGLGILPTTRFVPGARVAELTGLRGSALGFRNLTNYIARSSSRAAGRPWLHP